MSTLLPISAIIPVVNRIQFIRDAIFSILQGEKLPQELIIVLSPIQGRKEETNISLKYLNGKNSSTHTDDVGSTTDDMVNAIEESIKDASHCFLSSTQKKYFQARSIHCTRPYVAAARNEGAIQAKNPWLAFLDSDDLWTEKKLNEQWNYLQKRPHLMACHCAEEWIKKGKKLKHPSHLQAHRGKFLQAALENCLLSCSALLIKKEIFQKCGSFDESFEVCEDFAFCLHYLKRYPIGLVQDKLVIKRSGSWPQLSQKYHSLDSFRIQAILKFLKKHGKDIKATEHQKAKESIYKKLTILQEGAKRHQRTDACQKFQKMQKEIDSLFQ